MTRESWHGTRRQPKGPLSLCFCNAQRTNDNEKTNGRAVVFRFSFILLHPHLQNGRAREKRNRPVRLPGVQI